LAVAHDEFKNLDIVSLKNPAGAIIYDVKGMLETTVSDGRL